MLAFAILGTHVVAASLSNDGTVRDDKTHLVWQQDTSDAMSWSDAVSYCDNLVLARKNDWRLPTIYELNSIIDYSKSPSASPLFSFKPYDVGSNSWSWSSTLVFDNVSRAWGVDFVSAKTGNAFVGETLYARCVRG